MIDFLDKVVYFIMGETDGEWDFMPILRLFGFVGLFLSIVGMFVVFYPQ